MKQKGKERTERKREKGKEERKREKREKKKIERIGCPTEVEAQHRRQKK